MFKARVNQDPYGVFRIKDFRWFVCMRFFITLGFQMQTVIVGWQIYQITKDPLSLGLIGLAEAIPFILSALFAGHVADIVRRKLIIQVAVTLLFMCSSLLLLFAVKPHYIASFGATPIYFIIAFTGIARAFIHPSVTAFMAQLVERKLYANASTWNSTVWQIGAVSGPALGGLIYGFAGIQAAYASSASCILFSFVFLACIKNRGIPQRTKKERLVESLATGVRFVFSNKIVLSAISLDLFAVLFGGAVALLPVFASEVLNAGPEGLGILRAAPAFGAVLMALVMVYFPLMEKAGRNLLLSVAAFGACMVFFAFSTNFYLSLVLLAISGAVDNVSVVIRATIIQLLTPDEMRGRVSSVNSVFIGSSNEIGAFESGLAAKLFGLVASVAAGGCITIGIVGAAAKFAPGLKKLNINQLQNQA